MTTNTYPWKICTLTHRENGASSNRTLLGSYFNRQHALNDACRIANQLAGPERDVPPTHSQTARRRNTRRMLASRRRRPGPRIHPRLPDPELVAITTNQHRARPTTHP